MVQRGTPNINRIHAKNYIQDEADKRLKEVTRPYQQQGLNALGVDYHEVLLFLRKMSSAACTCREVQMETELGNAPINVTTSGGSHEISIDWRRPVFGESGEHRFEEEDGTELGDYDFDDSEPVQHANQLIESSADCGICYRTGFLPGYEQYGKRRYVLTTYDIVDQHAYTIRRTSAPHVFQRLHQNGWVEFEITVPKYFKSVHYSIRNNVELLDNQITTQSGICDFAYLQANAGKKTRLRVSAEEFTHAVLTFDMGTDTVRANIAQMSRATDWTLFSTIGNINVILPMTIPELTNGSYIIVPKFGIALIVTDVTYLRVADGNNLDWSVNTRVSQPQEAVTRIHKGFPLL